MGPPDLELRRIEPGDAAALARLHALEGVMANTLQLPYPSAASWTERLERFAKEDYVLVGVIEQAVIATAGLHMNASRRRAHAATLAIVVHDDWQGRGIGGAMLAELIRIADGWLNLARIELTAYVDNAAALALYRKCGFEVEGRHRRYAFRAGVHVDALAMARIRPDLPDLPDLHNQIAPDHLEGTA